MMRNLLAVLALATLVFVGVGYSCGWYSIQSETASPGRSAFRVEIDRTKIGQDLMEGARKVQRVLSKDKDNSGEADPSAGSNPQSVP
jgi:hypothetical protein